MKNNRKCKKCQGKEFIFGKNYIIKEGSFGYELHEYGSLYALLVLERV